MNVEYLKQVLAVPTQFKREEQMVRFLLEEAAKLPGVRFDTDGHNNVFIRRGNADFLPCVSAHIDSVQPINRQFTIEEQNGLLIGRDMDGRQVGFGGDDKAGVYICLEMLHRFDNIAAFFFASEEIGCQGAHNAAPEHFQDIGYVLEFDCPSNDMFSYTSGGKRLFANDGEFITRAFPVLNEWGVTKWQHHPYSDVMMLRRRFDLSCMNLSCGYYNWHNWNECVKISDTANSVEMATALIGALGTHNYAFSRDITDEAMPLTEVTPLVMPVLA